MKICRRHIGELVVTGPNGTDVAIDGGRVGTLPSVQPMRLVEGNAVVTANSAGFKDFSKTVTIAGGAKVSVAIVLDAVEKRASVAVAAPVPLPPGPSDFAGADHRGGRARGAQRGRRRRASAWSRPARV